MECELASKARNTKVLDVQSAQSYQKSRRVIHYTYNNTMHSLR